MGFLSSIKEKSSQRDISETDSQISGSTVVQRLPQTTLNPLDPLNWTKWNKHCILGIVMFKYFMFTYITTTTVPSFLELQKLYNVTYSEITWTIAVPSLGLCIGPLVWSSLSDIYGRRLIFIVGTTTALAATIGTAVSKSYGVYMIARAFQGLGVSPGGTVGMAIINDIFFEHERGQKIGLWVLSINTGLMVGPIVGGFMDTISPMWINWMTAILFCLLLLLEMAFLPETLFPRSVMLKIESSQRSWSSSKVEEVLGAADHTAFKQTKNLAFLNLTPILGVQATKPWDSLVRFGHTFRLSAVAVTCVVFCFVWYWWLMSIVTLIPAAYEHFKPSQQGLLFLGLLVGTWFAEICCSGRLSDAIIRRLSKSSRDGPQPEMRLWLSYPGALLTAAGLALWGLSIDQHWHWMVGQTAFFLFAVGLQMGNTVISSYVVDCYPKQSMSIITFYSVLLDLSAFINPFFINAWVLRCGYTITFCVQAVIVIGLAIPAIALVHRFGATMRARSWTPTWANPEYDMLLDTTAIRTRSGNRTLSNSASGRQSGRQSGRMSVQSWPPV